MFNKKASATLFWIGAIIVGVLVVGGLNLGLFASMSTNTALCEGNCCTYTCKLGTSTSGSSCKSVGSILSLNGDRITGRYIDGSSCDIYTSNLNCAGSSGSTTTNSRCDFCQTDSSQWEIRPTRTICDVDVIRTESNTGFGCDFIEDCDAQGKICSGYNPARCATAPSCSDGIKNQNELQIDCGGVCSPCLQYSSSCYNNDVYWYNSAGSLGIIKERCYSGTSYGSWSPSTSNYCSGTPFIQSRTNTVKGCSGSFCYLTPTTETRNAIGSKQSIWTCDNWIPLTSTGNCGTLIPQSRTCIDSNGCNINKPSESQTVKGTNCLVGEFCNVNTWTCESTCTPLTQTQACLGLDTGCLGLSVSDGCVGSISCPPESCLINEACHTDSKCYDKYDKNFDGKIDRTELGEQIYDWKDTYTIENIIIQVRERIIKWKNYIRSLGG